MGRGKKEGNDVRTDKNISEGHKGPVTHEDLQALEKKIMAAIEERFRARTSLDDMNVRPPLPPKTGPHGKALKGERLYIRALVDKVLYEKFMQEAKDHHNESLSRCLDAILWNHYGKPKLSFEEDES